MNTAQVLQFPAVAAERAPETLPRLVLMHRGETFDYETPEDFEAELQAMLIREGWTPPPEAVADATSPPEALAQPVAARPWPPVQDFLIVALGLAVVFLALAAGL